METITREDLEAAAVVVHAHVPPTPEIVWPLLSERAGAEVWVKHENHTPIGAFKVRGGLVAMDSLRRRRPDVTGVICATRGNHGQSVAFAARSFGLTATIVIPKGNNPEKNDAMEAYGARLIEKGHDFQAAYEYAAGLAEEKGLTLVESFSRPLAMGAGTYALEFLSRVPDLDTVYVPIGMGSGISGVISARDALGLKTRVVGVVAEGAPCYALSFEAGRAVSTDTADTIAGGVACRVPDEDALGLILEGAERVVRVTDDAIMEAMGHYLTDTHNLAEGAGAAPLAALLDERHEMAGRKVGLVLSGGNAGRAVLRRVLDGG